MTNNPGQTHFDPAAEQAASDAARLEAIQWLHWARRELDRWPHDDTYHQDEEDAMARGEAGIRPDAQALAAAQQAGFEAGRESVLRVLEQWQSSPAQAADLRYRILAACNAAPQPGGTQ